MDIDREEVYEGLLRWISSLNPGSQPPSLEWMLTGKPMAEALILLVPEFYDADWLNKTCSGIEDTSNWRVKANALKKIIKSILEAYIKLTGQSVSDEHLPDANVAARDENKAELSKAELSKMMQLILALAVNGSKRQDAIEHIMKLEESVQHVVMMSIQELEERKRSGSLRPVDSHDANFEARLRKALSDLERAQESNDELARRCHELDLQIDALQDEKRTLFLDKERLVTRLASSEQSDDSASGSSKRVNVLQQQIEHLQDELFRLEGARDDSKMKCDSLVRENRELQLRIDEMISNDAEYRKLKDEVDELRGKLVEAKKLEGTLDVYKRKLEEMNDLRLQLKITQDKNELYMKCAIDLDEEQRRNGALKTQLEAYKRQLQDIESKLTEETKRADKMEFEARRCKERMESLQEERDRLLDEKNELRSLSDDLKYIELQNTATNPEMINDERSNSALSGAATDAVDMREQLLRLDHENRILKATRAGSRDGEMLLLTSQLEDASRRKQELETDLRLSNKKLIEVEAALADIREAQLAGSGGSGDARLVDLHRQVEYHSIEAQKAKQRLLDIEKTTNEKDQKLKTLEEQLQSKEVEIKAQETKYKGYLEKARTVIVSLEQPLGGSNMGSGYSRAEFDALRRQLQEKEKLIQQMQEDQEKLRIMKEQEERLLTTAFHGMAMQLHRRGADERLAATTGQNPASFLVRQRQVTSKRPTGAQQYAGAGDR